MQQKYAIVRTNLIELAAGRCDRDMSTLDISALSIWLILQQEINL